MLYEIIKISLLLLQVSCIRFDKNSFKRCMSEDDVYEKLNGKPCAMVDFQLKFPPLSKNGSITTYKAIHNSTKMPVILRNYRINSSNKLAARAEGCILGSLVYENGEKLVTPRLHCMFDNKTTLGFFVLEYINGESLSSLISGNKACQYLPLLVENIGYFLNILHNDLNYIHHQISSDHILIDEEGNPRLIGFGQVGPINERFGLKMNKLYAAPELLMAQKYPQHQPPTWERLKSVDWYSLGVCAVEACETSAVLSQLKEFMNREQYLFMGLPDGYFNSDSHKVELYEGLLEYHASDRWNWNDLSRWVQKGKLLEEESSINNKAKETHEEEHQVYDPVDLSPRLYHIDKVRYDECMNSPLIDTFSRYIPYSNLWNGYADRCTENLFTRNVELGKGSFGTVTRAVFTDSITQELTNVAIKSIKVSQRMPHKDYLLIRMEECMLASITTVDGQSPMAPKLHCVYVENDSINVVMEYVEGMMLSKRKALGNSCQFLLKVLYEVGSFIEFLHSNGFMHHDIKPENIIIDKKGNPRLIDFGMAGPVTEAFSNKYTSLYAPPELLRTKKGPKPETWEYLENTEWYAIGMTAFDICEKEKIYPSEKGTQAVEFLAHGIDRGIFVGMGRNGVIYSGLLNPTSEERWGWPEVAAWVEKTQQEQNLQPE